jgi:hypothetical protein
VSLAGLLTPAEEQFDARTGQLRFDIGMLALRVTALTDWLAGHPPYRRPGDCGTPCTPSVAAMPYPNR